MEVSDYREGGWGRGEVPVGFGLEFLEEEVEGESEEGEEGE